MKTSLKKYLRFSLGVFTLAVFLFASFHYFAYQKFMATPININQTTLLEVKSGQGAISLAQSLEAKNVITNANYLRLYLRLNPEQSKIKVGEYQIEVGLNPEQLLSKLVEGDVIQYQVTFVEGINIYQLLSQLDNTPHLKRDWPTEESLLAKALGIPYSKVEGWIYPDTYSYTKNTSGLALLKRAYQQTKAHLSNAWEIRAQDLPYSSPYDALIMASIIEKETGIASEREMIAGVFVRRLEKNMRLQTDPTVIYGVGPSFDGDITYKHLRTPTAYNTYVIKGLPPSPIAMPGVDSINAALNPSDGKWLYFVATGDGGHYFSETLEEHNKAVKRYLRRQKGSD